jgi:hypothetical protein
MRMPKRRARKTDKSDFVSWIEKTIHLPLGLSAEPGAITLPIFLREIAAAMTDPAVEKRAGSENLHRTISGVSA